MAAQRDELHRWIASLMLTRSTEMLTSVSNHNEIDSVSPLLLERSNNTVMLMASTDDSSVVMFPIQRVQRMSIRATISCSTTTVKYELVMKCLLCVPRRFEAQPIQNYESRKTKLRHEGKIARHFSSTQVFEIQKCSAVYFGMNVLELPRALVSTRALPYCGDSNSAQTTRRLSLKHLHPQLNQNLVIHRMECRLCTISFQLLYEDRQFANLQSYPEMSSCYEEGSPAIKSVRKQ